MVGIGVHAVDGDDATLVLDRPCDRQRPPAPPAIASRSRTITSAPASTAASVAARNLSVLVLDNGHYSETGGQPTHTSGRTSLAGVAQACGFTNTGEISASTEFAYAKETLLNAEGPSLIVAKVAIKKYGAIVEPQTRKGHYIASRFRMATTGEGEAVLG